MKDASSSTAALIGRMIGGQAGSVAAGTAADSLITGIDSARNKKYTPYGVVHYASNVDKLSPGEHFDQWMNLGAGTHF